MTNREGEIQTTKKKEGLKLIIQSDNPKQNAFMISPFSLSVQLSLSLLNISLIVFSILWLVFSRKNEKIACPQFFISLQLLYKYCDEIRTQTGLIISKDRVEVMVNHFSWSCEQQTVDFSICCSNNETSASWCLRNLGKIKLVPQYNRFWNPGGSIGDLL